MVRDVIVKRSAKPYEIESALEEESNTLWNPYIIHRKTPYATYIQGTTGYNVHCDTHCTTSYSVHKMKMPNKGLGTRPRLQGSLYSTFHKSTTQVGAGAWLKFRNQSFRPLLARFVHSSEAKVKVDLGVIGHQRQAVT